MGARDMKRVEQIGDATLYLGDCREVLPLIGRPDVVITDPPFGMSFRSNYRQEQHRAIANDGDEGLLRWACEIPARHSKYVFCRWDNVPGIPKPKSLVTWVKNSWSMGDLEHEHARQTEVAAFYPGPDHNFPSGRPADVIEAPRTGNNYHPTEKPVALMWRFVTWTAGVVLDPFMGSGTTGVACAQLGRPFVGVELDEQYFDTACRRIEAAHKQPRLFDELPAKPVQRPLFDGAAA